MAARHHRDVGPWRNLRQPGTIVAPRPQCPHSEGKASRLEAFRTVVHDRHLELQPRGQTGQLAADVAASEDDEGQRRADHFEQDAGAAAADHPGGSVSLLREAVLLLEVVPGSGRGPYVWPLRSRKVSRAAWRFVSSFPFSCWIKNGTGEWSLKWPSRPMAAARSSGAGSEAAMASRISTTDGSSCISSADRTSLRISCDGCPTSDFRAVRASGVVNIPRAWAAARTTSASWWRTAVVRKGMPFGSRSAPSE